MAVRIHVIDPDSRRRASIAREFLDRGLHAEIYDSLDEFMERIPAAGHVFAHDDDVHCEPARLREAIRARGVALPVTFYTAEPAPERIVRAMQYGAWNYLRWPFDPVIFETSLEALAAVGERVMSEHRRHAGARVKVDQLTVRERDVLELIVKGNSNKSVALELDISPRTVEIHRSNMMRKLEAASTSEAVRIALYAGVDEDFAHGGMRQSMPVALDRAA